MRSCKQRSSFSFLEAQSSPSSSLWVVSLSKAVWTLGMEPVESVSGHNPALVLKASNPLKFRWWNEPICALTKGWFCVQVIGTSHWNSAKWIISQLMPPSQSWKASTRFNYFSSSIRVFPSPIVEAQASRVESLWAANCSRSLSAPSSVSAASSLCSSCLSSVSQFVS